MPLSEAKSGITVAQQVPAATTEETVHEVVADATIEHIAVRIYSGAENTLRVRLRVRSQTAMNRDLVTSYGKNYIDGDDDVWEWDIAEPVEAGDELVIIAENTDGANAHNHRVNLDLDYLGGTERASRWARQALGGLV